MKKLFSITLLIGNVAFAEIICEKSKEYLVRCQNQHSTHTEVCYKYTGYNVSCFVLQNQSAVN